MFPILRTTVIDRTMVQQGYHDFRHNTDHLGRAPHHSPDHLVELEQHP